MTELFRTGYTGKKIDNPILLQELFARPSFFSPFFVGQYKQNDCQKFELPDHIHPGIEVSLICKGTSTVIIDDMYYDLQPGDCYFTNAMVPHGMIVTRAPFISRFSHISEASVLSIPPPDCALRILRTFFVPLTHGTPVLCNAPRIAALLSEACDLYESSLDPFGKTIAWSRIVEMLTLVAGTVLPLQTGNEIAEKNNAKIIEAVAYIHTHYHQPLKIEQVAQRSMMSTPHFYSLFSKIMATPPYEYINKIRINQAYQQLISTDKKISTIAFDCGFDSVRAFNKSFRKIVGNSPSSLRKS